MTREEILLLLTQAKTQREVNILRSNWVRVSNGDLEFNSHIPKHLQEGGSMATKVIYVSKDTWKELKTMQVSLELKTMEDLLLKLIKENKNEK